MVRWVLIVFPKKYPCCIPMTDQILFEYFEKRSWTIAKSRDIFFKLICIIKNSCCCSRHRTVESGLNWINLLHMIFINIELTIIHYSSRDHRNPTCKQQKIDTTSRRDQPANRPMWFSREKTLQNYAMKMNYIFSMKVVQCLRTHSIASRPYDKIGKFIRRGSELEMSMCGWSMFQESKCAFLLGISGWLLQTAHRPESELGSERTGEIMNLK